MSADTHRTCPECGATFRFRKRADREQTYCSAACYHAAQRRTAGDGKVTVHCAKCGKELRRWPAHARAINYCSRACANSANHPSVRENPDPHGPPVERQCLNCGATFFVYPYRKKSARFCSRACGYAYRKIGDSFTNFRARALRALPSRCMICGFDIVVHAHHIVPRSQGGSNEPENTAVLCPNHHYMAHRGLIPADDLTTIVRAAIAQLSDHQRQSGPLSLDPPDTVAQAPLSD